MSALPTPDPAAGGVDLDARYDALARAERLLPVKVTAFYRRKLDEEAAAVGPGVGPLHRTARPVAERFAPAVGDEVDDWVDDRSNMPTGTAAIVHKYPDRVLFMPTSVCAGHCQYCFRQDVLTDAHAAGRTGVSAELDRLVDHLAAHPEVTEVILSGGDPMTLPLRDLAAILNRLAGLPRPPSIRIHTRTLAFAPKTFADPAKLDLLAAADVRLVHHFVHPYEVCDEVAAVLRELRRRDVRMYNHFPLIRGVNDHVAVLDRLIRRLDDERVRTLSVYVPEPIRRSAPFRLSLKRVFALQDALTETTPSWVNAVRFTLDSPIGKVRRDHVVAWDEAARRVTFARDGRRFVYPDFPPDRDVPGDPAVMLWRG